MISLSFQYLLFLAFLFNGDPPREYTNFVLRDFDGIRYEFKTIVDSSAVTILTFWASWCEPCKKEMQELEIMRKKDFCRNVSVVAVNIDVPRGALKARKLIAENKYGFIIMHDERGEVKDKYSITVIPRAFLIDKKGVIRFDHQGFKDIKEIEKEIQSMK